MPRRRSSSIDEQAYRVAYLYAEHRQSQADIATALALSQAAVSRALSRARELGCVEESYRFVRPPGLSDDVIQNLENALGYSALATKLQSLPRPVRYLRVFDSGSDDAGEEAIKRRQREFGIAAAGYVVGRLRTAQRIGVAWGSTLGRVVDGITRTGYPWRGERAFHQVVPVSAEPIRFGQSEHTASALARRLDIAINGELPYAKDGMPSDEEQDRRLALTGVPAFIPREIDTFIAEQKALRAEERTVLAAHFPSIFKTFFLQKSPAYRRIFGGDTPLVDQLDVVLTSAGSSVRAMGFCNEELRNLGGVSAEELERLIVGDLGGVLLPRHNLSEADKKEVARLSAMWTGVSYGQLDRIAQRAAESDSPGIIVLAIGRQRSEVVCEVLVRGLCNELVVDRDLAGALQLHLPRRMVGER